MKSFCPSLKIAAALLALPLLPACRTVESRSAPAAFDGATPLQWSVRLADSEIARRDDKLAWRTGGKAKWDYTAGLFTLSLLKLNCAVPTPGYVTFTTNAIGSFITDDGDIHYGIIQRHLSPVGMQLVRSGAVDFEELLFERVEHQPGFWSPMGQSLYRPDAYALCLVNTTPFPPPSQLLLDVPDILDDLTGTALEVLRDSTVIFEGELDSLRRFQENVDEVKQGTECGIGVKGYDQVRPGDQIECFERIEVQRTL